MRHQSVSARLLVQLCEGMGAPPPAHVVGPGALYLSDTTYFEPDLFVFPSSRGAPAVVVTDTIRWRPPGLEMIVPVNVTNLFAG